MPGNSDGIGEAGPPPGQDPTARNQPAQDPAAQDDVPELERLTDSGLDCLIMLAKMFEKPANIGQVRHARGKVDEVFDETDILISAKELGLKARAINAGWDRLGGAIALPAIARKASAAPNWRRCGMGALSSSPAERT